MFAANNLYVYLLQGADEAKANEVAASKKGYTYTYFNLKSTQ